MVSEHNRIMGELCFVQADNARKASAHPVSEHWFNNALSLDPENPLFLEASVYPLALQHKCKEAIDRCTKAMEKLEGYPKDNLHYTRSLLYLNTEDYLTGFKDFEIRLRQRPIAAIHDRLNTKPYWNGEPCKSLYIFGEQGFGDIIMFARYVPLIKSKFNVEKIYFEVPKSCGDLFRYAFRNSPEIEVISVRSTYELLGTDKEFLASDYYIQQLSLATLFKTTFDTVPDIHIDVDQASIDKFSYLKEKNTVAVLVGGRPENGDPAVQEWNARRNVSKERVEEILKDFHIVYIQQDLNPELKSWSDTAGVLANCKFAVCIDSGPIHLAGAMGVPTILLNHYQTCWRWTLDKERTPWYNNLVIIRQIREGDWEPVFIKLKDYIEKHYG